MAPRIADQILETGAQDSLLDPDARDECVAEATAAAECLELTATHRGLVNFSRTFYARQMRHPTPHGPVMTPGKDHGKHFEAASSPANFSAGFSRWDRRRRAASRQACPGRLRLSKTALADW
ncbi:MAG: TusE/DsrC/DsvC family sulfur relay protein [Gammaproteobacteria bacterium]|jgi:sulfur relay (sulfurtransferase) DsrC/TusE family protein